jgi:phospholipase C
MTEMPPHDGAGVRTMVDANGRQTSDLGPLGSIERIVVLMMENRSFDHMLGYLGLEEDFQELDGLQHARPNWDADGTEYKPHALGPGQTAFHEPGKTFDESLDPCHSPECVAEQLAEYHDERPGGFVKNFVAKKKPPERWRGLPMGYYTQECLPVYDFLARQFCVCDAWHSSIPGDTWPNRLYSLAGCEGHKVPIDWLERLAKLLPFKLPSVPIYDVHTFTRQLEGSQWRWYSDDPATLRGADKLYRRVDDIRRGNFALFDRKLIHPIPRFAQRPITVQESFLDDANNNKLPQVCWIDPNFVNLHVLNVVSNDDHPPADILAGQQLALDLYDALTKTAAWNDTLLVICYDEHGGFYDHVNPPHVPAGDGSKYTTYGARVPVIVVGPRVRPHVCHELFDHTSLIKTILRRFAPDPHRALARMPARVRAAQDLGVILQEEPRADLPSHEHLHPIMDQWRNRARAQRLAQGPNQASSAADGAGHPLVLTDYQAEFARFAHAINRIDQRHGRWRVRRARGESPPNAPQPGTEGPNPEAEPGTPARM